MNNFMSLKDLINFSVNWGKYDWDFWQKKIKSSLDDGSNSWGNIYVNFFNFWTIISYFEVLHEIFFTFIFKNKWYYISIKCKN